MTTKDILNQMEKEFDEKFVVECPTGINKGRAVLNPIFPEPVMSFFHSYTRTLLESFGEEIIPEIYSPGGTYSKEYRKGFEEGQKCVIVASLFKMGEIINSISK